MKSAARNRFFDNRLQVNDAAYLDNYKNYQNLNNEIASPLSYGAIGAVVTNAGAGAGLRQRVEH